MPPLAVSGIALAAIAPAFRILPMCHRTQVRRIDAPVILALVVDVEPIGRA
jgi:hypothetical protein